MSDKEDGLRVFSIEEANALVPELNDRIGKLLEENDAIQQLVTELYLETSDEPLREGSHLLDITAQKTDPPEVRALKRQLSSLIGLYRKGWAFIEELGAVIKDTDNGLLDFYGRIDDRLVWLCWKYGETKIEHYHDLDAGFSGRKSLASARKRMLN
jgi:hypothetical protein